MSSVSSKGSAGTGLERGALGELQVLFQAITSAGPAVGVAASLVFAATYAGGATPLTAVLTTIAVLFVAISMGQLGKHLPSAGGLYTYTTGGFGKRVGFMVSWALSFAYLVDLPLIFLLLAYIAQANLTSRLDAPTWVWVPITIVAVVLICALVFRGIKLSTGVGVVLGILEIAIFLALAVTLIAKAGSHNTLSVFTTSAAPKGEFGPVFAGMIFGILAFVGFDAAAPVAEEAREPRKTVPRALVWSVLITGAFFTFCFYAGDVFWGPGRIISGHNPFVALNGGDPFDGVASMVWGAGWVLVLLAVLNSTFASVLGITNGAVRISYALGRIGVFPRQAAYLHPRFRTPWVMILAVAVISLGVGLILGWTLGGPAAGFAFLGALVTLLFVPIYGLSSLSCMFYYLRYRRSEFNIFLHGFCPVLGALFLVPVLIAAFGIDFFGLGIPALAGAARWAPWIALGWLLLGVVGYFYLRSRRPSALEQLDRIFIDEPQPAVTAGTPPAAAAPTSPPWGTPGRQASADD
jgi:amino acid transporter